MNNAFFSDLLTSISERGRTLLRRAGSSDAKPTASDLIELCEALLSGRGEASGTAIAREVLDRYHDLDQPNRIAFFAALANRYGQTAIIGVFIVLWFVAPVSHAFFQFVLQITTLAGIDPVFIAIGQSNMRFR